MFNDVDYLILNEVECQQLSCLDITSPEIAKKASLTLFEKFKIRIGVIVTLGEMGVVYTDKLMQKYFEYKCQKVNVVDTTVIFIDKKINFRFFSLKINQF